MTVEIRNGARQIEAASPEALALGIRPGQPLTHARAVCGHLLAALADPAGDAAGLAEMARWCERLSPLTAIDPPDGLWIDITGCAHLFGGEAALAQRLQQKLAPARIAIADTSGAAWALARAGQAEEVRIAAPGEHHRAIAPLPPALLRLPPKTAASLHKLGIREIGHLYDIPRAQLPIRFGGELLARLDHATGRTAEPIVWQRPAQMWSVHKPFVEPVATPEDLQTALLLLATDLCRQLENARLGGTSFRASFFRVDGEIAVLHTAAAAPLRKADHLARLLGDQLEQIDPGLGIEAMRLEAEAVADLAGRQVDIEAAAHDEAENLSETLNLLTNRLGANNMWRQAPHASHVPERAVLQAPALAFRKIWKPPAGKRPLRLLSPPEPIEAIAPVPDDPPILFRWRGVPHRIRAASLPERIAAEWWRRNDSDERFRDYYRVEDASGERFWVFRTAQYTQAGTLRWYLHGLFG